jgi:hypothetical protein
VLQRLVQRAHGGLASVHPERAGREQQVERLAETLASLVGEFDVGGMQQGRLEIERGAAMPDDVEVGDRRLEVGSGDGDAMLASAEFDRLACAHRVIGSEPQHRRFALASQRLGDGVGVAIAEVGHEEDAGHGFCSRWSSRRRRFGETTVLRLELVGVVLPEAAVILVVHVVGADVGELRRQSALDMVELVGQDARQNALLRFGFLVFHL